MTTRQLGIAHNKLLRYKLIKELYDKYDDGERPLTTILKKYIKPVYPISRTTLYNILCTPINKDLKEIEEMKAKQIKIDF